MPLQRKKRENKPVDKALPGKKKKRMPKKPSAKM